MTNLTLQQLQQYAKNAGFSGQGLTDIVAISEAEDTSGNPLATNTVGNSAGTDRGVLQINSYYHPEVSNACAFDPQCAFDAAFNISDNGTNFEPWATFTSGKYLQFLSGSSISTDTSSIPTTTSNVAGALTAANVQGFFVQGLFVVGGIALVIMGFILAFKIHPTRLPI
jgi:hypothetical protein